MGVVLAEILGEVEKIAEGASQSDDITILVVQYRRPVNRAGGASRQNQWYPYLAR